MWFNSDSRKKRKPFWEALPWNGARHVVFPSQCTSCDLCLFIQTTCVVSSATTDSWPSVQHTFGIKTSLLTSLKEFSDSCVNVFAILASSKSCAEFRNKLFYMWFGMCRNTCSDALLLYEKVFIHFFLFLLFILNFRLHCQRSPLPRKLFISSRIARVYLVLSPPCRKTKCTLRFFPHSRALP